MARQSLSRDNIDVFGKLVSHRKSNYTRLAIEIVMNRERGTTER